MFGTILTGVIGTVARGAFAKAIAGSVAGAVATQAGPLVDVFAGGVITGATPAVGSVGQMVGELVIGGAIGWILTYFAPKNKPT